MIKTPSIVLARHQLEDILNRQGDCLRQLESVYRQMDADYAKTARRYGFECRGCDDNCCLTRFYHHTLVETAGLFAGYLDLPEDQRRQVHQRAHDYDLSMRADQSGDETRRPICPLNMDTMCILYRVRPMICRLHGIPHTMRHPAKGMITGTGCHVFEASHTNTGGFPLDRTPIYAAMARLEQALRRNAGITAPVRLTVAQMILCFEDPIQVQRCADGRENLE
jgi:hypothetical protein